MQSTIRILPPGGRFHCHGLRPMSKTMSRSLREREEWWQLDAKA